MVRTDVTIADGGPAREPVHSELVEDAVGRAVRLDAACVVASLLSRPDRPELQRACIRNVGRLKADCEPAGMPLMVAPLAIATDGRPGERTAALVRHGAAGLVYAGSVPGHESAVAFTRALMAVVHGGMSADEALLALGD